MNDKKVCVYTCVTGDYDDVTEISILEEDIDYYLFTNNKKIVSKTWKVIYVEDKALTNTQLARKIKILGYEGITDQYDLTIWIDGNVAIRKKIRDFLKEKCNLNQYAMVAFRHSLRDCAYDEALMCLKYHKEKKEKITKILDFLEEKKYPKHYGLIESGVLIRKPNDPLVKKTMERWFSFIKDYTTRDQLSFNYSCFETNLKVQYLNDYVLDNPYFIAKNHCMKKEVSNYRFYFGKEEENFQFDLDIQDQYIRNEEGYYCASCIIPCDTDMIQFEPDIHIVGLYYKHFLVHGVDLQSTTVENGYMIGEETIFVGITPRIFLKGNFKKGQRIEIQGDFQIASQEKWSEMFQKCQTEIANYLKKIDSLEKKNAKEIAKQEKLQQEYDHLKMVYDQIVQSKGWRMIEKIRSFRRHFHR